jgi:hypothetical protein
VDRRPPGGFPHCVLDASVKRATPGRWYRGATVGPPGFEDPCYAHESSVMDLARQLGWVSPYQSRLKDEQIDALKAEAAALTGELQDARRRLEAVDVIESAGFRARKKAGRPAKEAVT